MSERIMALYDEALATEAYEFGHRVQGMGGSFMGFPYPNERTAETPRDPVFALSELEPEETEYTQLWLVGRQPALGVFRSSIVAKADKAGLPARPVRFDTSDNELEMMLNRSKNV